MQKETIQEAAVADMTKDELKKFIEDIVSTELNKSKYMTKDDVRSMVRAMLKKQYELFWQKSSFFLDKI